MDRLNRALAGCGLALVVAATGCRSTRPEVPPGRSYSNDGRQAPPVGFSSEAHPMSANALGAVGPNGMPAPGDGLGGVGAGQNQFGTPAPNSPAMGAPTGNGYGPPGTAGAAPGVGGAAAPASPSSIYPPAGGAAAPPSLGQPGAAPGSM